MYDCKFEDEISNELLLIYDNFFLCGKLVAPHVSPGTGPMRNNRVT